MSAIDKLSLKQKVRLLTGASMFSLYAEPDIGLAALNFSDGPTGVRGSQFTGGAIASLLPNATLLAQHWDTATAAEVGELLAEEAAAQDVHVVLGPTINLHRTPLGGRLFEAYSEDALLTGALTTAYVKAMQDKGIGATLKHFIANESETERNTVSSELDERTLREIYLLPFEMAVEDANPWAVMAAYNKINGTLATEHHELIEGILKGEWQYTGLVMSDWFATQSTVDSVNSGLDLVMPGPEGPWGARLVEAVRSGLVEESTVDDHLRRLLRLAERVGAFGTSPSRERAASSPDSPARREQLRVLAARGMTVLVNRNATLPLNGEKVVVIGRHAIETIAQGGGSAQVRPPHVVSIAEALHAELGAKIVDGVEVRAEPLAAAHGMLRDPRSGKPGIRVRTMDSAGEQLDSRHVDWTEIAVGEGRWLDKAASIELSAELAIEHPARMQVGVRGPGEWEFNAPGHHQQVRLRPDAAIGSEVLRPPNSTAVLDLEPGALLRATVPAEAGMRVLGLIARPAAQAAATAISAAVRAAREAEVAVVVVGLTQEQETEAADKTTLALPGEQDALVAAVAAQAKRTVVVVNAASPVLMPWRNQVDAVLWAGLPGQEAGAAVAAALTGEVEPAGRLVTTFPARDGDGPAWSTTPVDGVLRYAEGTAVGYRGWQTEPMFWFGHGLGYTTWDYGAATLTMDGTSVRTVRVEVTNSGARRGREVVQVYRRPGDEPVRLIGWEAVELEPGASAVVEVNCEPRVQRIWTTHGWSELPAEGELLIARGLGDIRAKLSISG